MSITNYTTLQSTVTDWLMRPDLTGAPVQSLIQAAEGSLKRDHRVRRLVSGSPFSVSAASTALPAGIYAIESIYHDGPVKWGPVQIVSSQALAGVNAARAGATGAPTHGAVIEGTYPAKNLLVAPVPDGTYALKLTYWEGLASLSGGAPTNWLLLAHPDIYLYAVLAESAPYLKDDERLMVWKSQLETKLEELHQRTWDGQFSGPMRMPIRAIGG